MDKLTLTRQFGIQFDIFLGRYREGIGIRSIHTEEKVLSWFCTYGIGIEEEEKPKISHSTFDRKINQIYFVPFVQWSNSTGSNLWDLRNDIKKKRGKKKWILNKNEVEEPRFQMNKFKLENFRFSKNEGQGDWSRKIFCSYYRIVIGSAYVW